MEKKTYDPKIQDERGTPEQEGIKNECEVYESSIGDAQINECTVSCLHGVRGNMGVRAHIHDKNFGE